MSTAFRATRALGMQPTRMMFMKRSPAMLAAMRQSPRMYLQQTKRMMTPVPKEEQGAHTISQRLRTLKSLPAEIWPLIIVLAVAVIAAFYSLIRKLFVDKTLRLSRQRGNQ